MAKEIICLLVIQTCICKVLSIYAQPTIQQYLQLTGTPHPTHTTTVAAPQQTAPPPNIPPTNPSRPATGLPSFSALALPDLLSRLQQLPAIQQTAPPPNHVTNQARPPTGTVPFSEFDLSILVSTLQQLSNQRPVEVKPANPSSIDSKLLNNLAIALQLLIVSNILNSPPPVDSSSTKTKEIPRSEEPNSALYYSQAQVGMPGSNFIGSSSFAEPQAPVYKPTRNSMFLMSPYEALGPSSTYSDPILTQYASMNPRQDFQSPYAMMTDNDLFSMSDLF